MNKSVAIIQARSNSSRLPNKVLLKLGDETILERIYNISKKIPGVDEIWIATSNDNSDDVIETLCQSKGMNCYRGDLHNVLERYYSAAQKTRADIVLRITADCPFLDPQVCGTLLALLKNTNSDYVSNTLVCSWPDGLDCEVFTFNALEVAQKNATLSSEKEHVTAYIMNNRHSFKTLNLTCPLPKMHKFRWTLDHEEDYLFARKVYEQIKNDSTNSYLNILSTLNKQPELLEINSNIKRNEGWEISQQRESFQPKCFKKSQDFLSKVEPIIPLGSQTFSKSKIIYTPGHAPLFASHGSGGRIWDIDGNEYVDLVNGLLPNVLGYNDPDVDSAIRAQLDKGITLSLSTELEYELAHRITEIIPCAESVRFGKNGSDATTACIRLARAHTSRDKILVCGYHGWHDWYIGSTTRNKGVPHDIQKLTTAVPFNDLNKIEDILSDAPNSYACMIMEPMNAVDPIDNYYTDLKQLLHKHGVLLIFDEIITGFRYSLGGAQKLFGITPDLAAFGKSMANGMPISVVTGRKDIMAQMEEIFFSGTFGGEALSLAAAIATIDKMKKEPVIETLWETGKKLKSNLKNILVLHGLEKTIELKGKDPWVLLGINAHKNTPPEVIKTFLISEMFQRNTLMVGSHNISYAHSPHDISTVISAYKEVLELMAAHLENDNLVKNLRHPVIQPVFKVR